MSSVIVFDFDGTLADSLSVMLRVYNEIAAMRGLLEVRDAEWQKLRRMRITEGLRFIGVKPYQVPGLLALGKRQLQAHKHEISLFAGIADVIKQLSEAGHELYVLSTNSKDIVQSVLAKHGLIEFVHVLGSSKIFGKAQAVRHLIKKLKVDPGNVWMIGDEIRDIQAAKRAHVRIIAVAWGAQPEDILSAAGPTAIASKPQEIVSLLNTRQR